MDLRHLLDQGSRLIGTTALLAGLTAMPDSTAWAQPYGLGRPHNNAAAFAPQAYQPPQYMVQAQYAPQQVAMRPWHHQHQQPAHCPPGYQPGYAPQQPGEMQIPGTMQQPSTAWVGK